MEKKDTEKAKSPLKGALCLTASAFGFALMAALVRLSDDFGPEASTFQKSLFRNAIAVIIAFSVFVRSAECRRSAAAVPRAGWALLLLRSAAGCIGIFGNFYALSKIPIGEAMALNKTAPFFTVLFTWMFLGEKIRFRQALCLAVAFAGAMLVMKPGFRGAETFASLCALAGGLGAGIAYTCVRELGVMGVRGPLIVLFFSAFSTLAALPFLAFGATPMTPAQIAIMTGAGCGGAIGQFGVTAAYRYAQPRQIAALDYTNVVFTAIFGYLLFGQIPDAWSSLGFALIVAAALRSAR